MERHPILMHFSILNRLVQPGLSLPKLILNAAWNSKTMVTISNCAIQYNGSVVDSAF